MSNATNYPSCIKIPIANSKQNTTSAIFSQMFDVREALALNNELILLANRLFGEGKWSHAVTNQTLDFNESLMGKYICGCATFVKIHVNETYHEDMGYCHAEGATKGLAIHRARAGSLTDAFKKALLCFGETIEAEIQKLMKKLQNTAVHNTNKEDAQILINSLQSEIPEPCAQSTPYIQRKDTEYKEKTENVLKSKRLNNQKEQHSLKRKSFSDEQCQTAVLVNTTKIKSPINDQLQSVQETNIPNSLDKSRSEKRYKNQVAHNENEELSELELLRMERKRRQMEKQAEYKKLMKQKEQQKLNDNKKPNPKY